MTAEIGTVVGIDREAGIVHAFLASGAAVDAYFMGDPPWPLSTAMFDGAPEYVCLGPLGFHRPIFRDDFMWLNTADFAPDLIGDSSWNGAGTGTITLPSDPSDAAGMVRLSPTTGGNNYYIQKRDRQVELNADRVYWLTARVRANDANTWIRVGLGNSDVINSAVYTPASTDAGAVAFIDASGTLYTNMNTYRGTTVTGVTSGEEAAQDVWMWVDLMVAGGQWAALWVNGSGPWFNTTEVPDTTVRSVTPFFEVFSNSGAISGDIDLMALSSVWPANSPVDLGLAQVPDTDAV